MPTASWEETVGSDWLNKIGVLVIVIGIALAVTYSFTQVGPIGRVAMGFALSATMLGLGVVFARRERFGNYGHGLVAGGWAGIYFTAYATHGIRAVRLIDDPLAATLLLLVVAAGMIGHGLRYRSQTVTALTFVVGYATLSLTPLTTFALIAAVPLAASVMTVGQRYGWTGISVLGVAGTYGLIALRGLGVGGSLEPASFTPAVLLAVYWATFEVADILGHRKGRVLARAHSIAALNALGFLTTTGLVLPLDEPERLSSYLAVMSAAALASTWARRRLTRSVDEPDVSPGDGIEAHHVPMVMSALLIVVSTAIRFDGADLALRWLVEAELFFAAGLVLGDGPVRRTGSIMMLLPIIVALVLPAQAEWLGLPDTTFVLALLAVVAYSNREWLRTRTLTPADPETFYGWTGSFLVAVVLMRELEGGWPGLALMAFAAVLLEAGSRRAAEYRRQAYVAGLMGALMTGLYFTGDSWAPSERWTLLPAAVALAWGWALRLKRHQEGEEPELAKATLAASWLGTWLLAILEWRVVPEPWLAPSLALTGAVLIGVALGRRLGGLWWQGYALLAISGLTAVELLTGADPPDVFESVALLTVIGVSYGSALFGQMRDERPDAPVTEMALTALSVLATGLLTAFEWQQLSNVWREPAIASTGLALVVLGVTARRPLFRWQGYGLLFGAALSAMSPVLEPNPLFDASTMAALVCVALLFVAGGWGRLRLKGTAGRLETAAFGALFITGTVMLATIEWRVLPDAWAGPVKALTGLTFFGAGLVTSERGLRAQGRGLLFAAAARMVIPVFAASTSTPVILAMLFVIGCLYVVSLAATRMERDAATTVERRADAMMSITASTLLIALVADELRASLITAVWGLQGLLLMVVGFATRERLLRLSGLVVLALCVFKLFLYDLSELEAIARIVSFVVLGLVLLGVSWVYTRFGEQIRKYL